MVSVAVIFLSRALLILLFLPFSALDKILNFDAAAKQAKQGVRNPTIAKLLILIGLCVEVVMSIGVLTGIADRLAAFILAGYCGVTALLWKQFWTAPDFRLIGKSAGRDIFWDFLKNFALAGGLLLLAFGTDASGVRHFIDDPLTSSHPYATRQTGP